MENNNTPVRLLYITNLIYGSGGLERVLSIKTSAFCEMGYEVYIVTLNQGNNENFYQFHPGVKHIDISLRGGLFSRSFDYVRGIRSIVKNIRPSLIMVCDDGLKGLFIPITLGGKPCPIIYERHISKQVALSSMSSYKAYYFDKLMSVGARLYDRFVVLTSDNLSEWNGLNNLVVISNPLSFYPDSVSKLDNNRIIAVGKISYQKGYERLLEAWKLIDKRALGWSVHIYGVESDDGKLRALVKESGLENSFILHPPTQAIEQEYLKSSIYAFPSRFEGFGMVLIEAMACGVPCISFDCPCGPHDIIRDGEDGYLVENGNIIDFASRMIQLIEDNELRNAMAGKARENVKRYSIESIAQQWSGLFDDLLR